MLDIRRSILRKYSVIENTVYNIPYHCCCETVLHVEGGGGPVAVGDDEDDRQVHQVHCRGKSVRRRTRVITRSSGSFKVSD